MDELQDWIKKTDPVLTRIQPAPGTDDHSYGQLVKLLREKNYVGHQCLLAKLSTDLLDSMPLPGGRSKALVGRR